MWMEAFIFGGSDDSSEPRMNLMDTYRLQIRSAMIRSRAVPTRFWSAATGHSFPPGPATAGPPGASGRERPQQSADQSAHSKAFWLRPGRAKLLCIKMFEDCTNFPARGHPARSRFGGPIAAVQLPSHLTGKTAAAWKAALRLSCGSAALGSSVVRFYAD